MFRRISKKTNRVFKAIGNAFASCFKSVMSVAGYIKGSFVAFYASVKGYKKIVSLTVAESKGASLNTAFENYRIRVRRAIEAHRPTVSKATFVALPLIILFAVSAFSPVWANFTFAQRVVYGEATAGDVLDKATCENAKQVFVNSIGESGAESYLKPCSLSTVYSLRKNILSAEGLAEKMLDLTDQLVESDGLFVNGVLKVASCRSGVIENGISGLLALYKRQNADSTAGFVETVEVKHGYYPIGKCRNANEIISALTSNTLNLSVLVTDVEKYQEYVPYDIESTESSKLYVGVTRVESLGVEGVNDVVAKVTYVNGEEIARTVLNTTTVSEPVAQKVLVGTSKSNSASKKMLYWPIPKSTYYYISGKFGENRGDHYHGGIDLACKKGTPIYAALDGEVIFSGTSGDYGKCIKIKHANDMVTIYAHCSKLIAEVGQEVKTGEKIAEVGSTGKSTGNHLHFEVRIKNVRKNPLNYLVR